MAGYQRPGVYVSERLLPAAIAPVAATTSAGACVGTFAKGPAGVTLVRNWAEFNKTFGGYDVANPATFGVAEFFKNGGSELYVARALHSDAAQATVALKDGNSATYATVTAVDYGQDGTNLRVTLSLARTVDTVDYYDVLVTRDNGAAADIQLEQFFAVRFDSTTSSDFAESVINGISAYITISVSAYDKTPVVDTPNPLTGSSLDGTDPNGTDYENALAGFVNIDRELVVFAPEVTNTNALGETDGAAFLTVLAEWAETNNQFAVLDVATSVTTAATAITAASAYGTTSHAAVYFPGVYIQDPVGRSTQSLRLVGPAGSVAGLYTRTDSQVGPFKAPAGLRSSIGTAVATQFAFSNADLDLLNSAQTPVNAIRNIPGAGVVVMGARTLLQDGTANRYINTRRSLIHLNRELKRRSEFVLFENTDSNLWARVRTALGVFLNDYRNQGGLAGNTAAEAFYVKCDATNNTAQDVQNGVVNIEVGVALEYPAEFVSIVITQTSNG